MVPSLAKYHICLNIISGKERIGKTLVPNLQQPVKLVQNMLLTTSLLLNFDRFHIFFWCFHCWISTIKCQLGWWCIDLPLILLQRKQSTYIFLCSLRKYKWGNIYCKSIKVSKWEKQRRRFTFIQHFLHHDKKGEKENLLVSSFWLIPAMYTVLPVGPDVGSACLYFKFSYDLFEQFNVKDCCIFLIFRFTFTCFSFFFFSAKKLFALIIVSIVPPLKGIKPFIARRVTRNFLGQGAFLELGHFDKYSHKTGDRKVPQGKNPLFFSPRNS